MKQIEVEIMQQSYVLGCPDGQEERLREAVERVDNTMTGIRDAGRVRSRDRIAVLAALHMAFELADQAAWTQAQAQAAQELAAAAAEAAEEQPSAATETELGVDGNADLRADAQGDGAECAAALSASDLQRLQDLADRLGAALAGEAAPAPLPPSALPKTLD